MSGERIGLENSFVEPLARSRVLGRIASLLGTVGLFALAAVPGISALLLLMRPDLFLPF